MEKDVSEKVQRLNSLSYQVFDLKNKYPDVFNENLGLALEFKNFFNVINSLIDEEMKRNYKVT